MKHLMSVWQRLLKSPWRTIIPAFLLLLILLFGYVIWQPGIIITDGRHDRRMNAIWLQHGWLGDDQWFTNNQKSPTLFRDQQRIDKLAYLLALHHIKFVYPHMCPCQTSGRLPAVDEQQTNLFCLEMSAFEILPWVGGVLDEHVFLESPSWRTNFTQSCRNLLETYPEFTGVHINIEPLPSGNQAFIQLLKDLKTQLPNGKLLSVAAYPPPTYWQPDKKVHWEKNYFMQVASHVDQVTVMMYDTGLKYSKVYRSLMASWTQEILDWSGETDILLGIPTYTDDDVGYHDPQVENIENALCGINAGLSDFKQLPQNYQGIAIYCEWETEPAEWQYYQTYFLSTTAP